LQLEVVFWPTGEVTGKFSSVIDNNNGTLTLGYEVRRFVGVSSTPQLVILLDGQQLPGGPWAPSWIASFPASAGTLGESLFMPESGLLSGAWPAGGVVAVGSVSLYDEFGNPVSGPEHAALLSGIAEPLSMALSAATNPVTAPTTQPLVFEAGDDGSYSISLVVEVRRRSRGPAINCRRPFHAGVDLLSIGF
jgi:hypothetical protein